MHAQYDDGAKLPASFAQCIWCGQTLKIALAKINIKPLDGLDRKQIRHRSSTDSQWESSSKKKRTESKKKKRNKIKCNRIE